MPREDLSWSELVVYACRCGTLYAATVWRWIDVDAQTELADIARRRGPVVGECSRCGEAAKSAATWLEIRPAAGEASLMLSGDRRADVIEELRRHLEHVRARPEVVRPWLLHPTHVFVDVRDETTARRAIPQGDEDHDDDLPSPAWSGPDGGEDGRGAPRPIAVSGETRARVPSGRVELDAGIPQIIAPDAAPPASVVANPNTGALGALLGELRLHDGVVRAHVEVPEGALPKWQGAKLEARPVHLRGMGYPLLGVRLVAMYLGDRGCIDALVDPADPRTSDVFRALAESFVVEAVLESGGERVTRRLDGPGLEPNAALCLESARGLLARGEYPPQEFARAKKLLGSESVQVRLSSARESVAPGSYRFIVGAREAEAALDHLDRVSKKDTLARLLEVDGLPMREYDGMRRRVLEGSLAHGLCAPRRFWRRVVASGIAEDLEDYATKLADNRAVHEGEEGDLDEEEAAAAWESIAELCRLKGIVPPAALRRALGLPESAPPVSGPPTYAAGEIVSSSTRTGRSGEIVAGMLEGGASPARSPKLEERLRSPATRLRAATEALQGRSRLGDVEAVIDALEDFETDELLALLPDLSDLGPRVVPGLIAKLRSERREVRQAAVILLGMVVDPQALDHLAGHLVWEPTTVWVDVARALGSFGPSAIRVLCQVLRAEAGSTRESQVLDRVARAMAEVALSDDRDGPAAGRTAVEALSSASDPRVSAAARRALASLQDVSASGAEIRGERPLVEVTEIRGFSRRAYEAIMVPELEVEAEA